MSDQAATNEKPRHRADIRVWMGGNSQIAMIN